jgi:hypothetical protein
MVVFFVGIGIRVGENKTEKGFVVTGIKEEGFVRKERTDEVLAGAGVRKGGVDEVLTGIRIGKREVDEILAETREERVDEVLARVGVGEGGTDEVS